MPLAVAIGNVLRPVAGDYEAECEDRYQDRVAPTYLRLRSGYFAYIRFGSGRKSTYDRDHGQADDRQGDVERLACRESEYARRIFAKDVHGDSQERIEKEKQSCYKSARRLSASDQ